MPDTRVKVNIQVFPLPIIESALYTLSERIDGRIGEVRDGQMSITLVAIEEGLGSAEAVTSNSKGPVQVHRP